VTLYKNITPTKSLIDAVENTEWIFMAVPVQYFRSVLKELKLHFHKKHKWVLLSKGIENETLLLPSQIIEQVLGENVSHVALMGPSFAKDLAERQLTAMTAASKENEIAQELKLLVENEYLKIALSDDTLGVQLCAALKNVVTIGMGILDGAGYTDNTKAMFLVKSLNEIRQLVTALGGKPETVNGFAGIGDLVLTALGQHSRNLQVGRLVGQGQTVAEIIASKKTVAEGVATTDSVYSLIESTSLELPLFESLYHVVHQAAPVETFINALS
jgi:glycerol-3-phosphate dehydrogenase (NAD(P)+)